MPIDPTWNVDSISQDAIDRKMFGVDPPKIPKFNNFPSSLDIKRMITDEVRVDDIQDQLSEILNHHRDKTEAVLRDAVNRAGSAGYGIDIWYEKDNLSFFEDPGYHEFKYSLETKIRFRINYKLKPGEIREISDPYA